MLVAIRSVANAAIQSVANAVQQLNHLSVVYSHPVDQQPVLGANRR
jgi:hypothetical protein